MNVFLTGGSGYVGSYVLNLLLSRGRQVTALVHRKRPAGRAGVTYVQGDLRDPDSLMKGMQGCDAVIHLVGIIVEKPLRGVTFDRIHRQGTINMLEAARRTGIRRFVHMSALGTRPDAQTGYHLTKWAAEEAVRASGLDWTIFRPSFVAGKENEVIRTLRKVLSFAPVMPVFGDGLYELQPVPVETVAEGFVAALTMPGTIGKTYTVAGRERIAYKEMLRSIADLLGRRPLLVHVPAGLMKAVVPVLQHLPGFPITRDQLTMLLEGSNGDEREFLQDFGLEPLSFRAGLPVYLGKA